MPVYVYTIDQPLLAQFANNITGTWQYPSFYFIVGSDHPFSFIGKQFDRDYVTVRIVGTKVGEVNAADCGDGRTLTFEADLTGSLPYTFTVKGDDGAWFTLSRSTAWPNLDWHGDEFMLQSSLVTYGAAQSFLTEVSLTEDGQPVSLDSLSYEPAYGTSC